MSDPELDVIPRLREGIDLVKAGLSVDEGFVASRIDGVTRVKDIAILVNKTPEDTLRVLERLASVGVVRLSDQEPSRDIDQLKPSELKGVTKYGRFIFPPNLMMVEADFDEEERKRIIYFAEHLSEWTHYELLQVSPRADAKSVKRAYFLRSKDWHPDRFRRKKMGPYKGMIDRVFKAVQQAYKVLSNAEDRAEYDQETIIDMGEADIADMLASERRKERDSKRAEERRERRKKRNPIRKRILRAREIFQEAQELFQAGENLEALRQAQTALTFDARPEYAELVEQLKDLTGALKVDPLIKRGLGAENMTRWDVAFEFFQEAVRLVPDRGDLRTRLAFNQLRMRGDLKEATGHATRATQLTPDDPEAHFVLGLCYEEAGVDKSAVRAYSKAVELKPNYKEAKKKLRGLKWGF